MTNHPICSIEECDKAAFSKGWCNAHYKRWRKHGDPLGGGTPKGALLEYLNKVVLQYAGEDCLMWPYARTRDGYGQIMIEGKMCYVHRLACTHLHGAPPTASHEAAHLCGKGNLGCVNATHLMWSTRQENEAHKMQHGAVRSGESHSNSKLTDDQVRQIRALRGTILQKDIASMFDVTPSAVCHIQAGRRWKIPDEAATA